MRKLIPVIFITVVLLPIFLIGQADSAISISQINKYETQTKQLINYLQGTLNFIGDPNEIPSEKDIIFNESYLKLFASDMVQIEDDLDENRDLPLNKDVQAYLKDIDFFFKEARFSFEIENTESIITDSNKIVFKVTLNRNLQGITVENDTINNNQLRYIEINLDPNQKDLKIASIYTTKIQEEEEIRNWWNDMSNEWKNYFGKSVIVFDTLPFRNILWFSDSSVVVSKWVKEYVSDTLIIDENPQTDPFLPEDSLMVYYDTTFLEVQDTIMANTSIVFNLLKTFRGVKSLDLSNNQIIKDLKPISELSQLKEINIINTNINDLEPIRNLKNIEVLNCSGSAVEDLSSLRYLSSLISLNLSSTKLVDLTAIGGLENITKLNISNSHVEDITPLETIYSLNQLDISHTRINNLSPICELPHLSDVNISSTSVKSLEKISSLTSIQHLNIDSTLIYSLVPLSNFENMTVLQANNTNISSLKPLENKKKLKIIYCDNSKIDINEANNFMDENPGCLVIYNSQELEKWWQDLSMEWRNLFKQEYNISDSVSVEKLHELIQERRISVAFNKQIYDIKPLSIMHRLNEVYLQGTSISDLTPISGLSNIEELNISNTEIISLEPLSSLRRIRIIKLENTRIDNLSSLESASLRIIYCDNTLVREGEALRFKNTHPKTVVIYQSDNLRMWWNNLDDSWKDEFIGMLKLPLSPSNMDLQNMVDTESIQVIDNPSILNLNPLHKFLRLKELVINSTSITDISPIISLVTIEKLDISKNPISQVNSISELKYIKELLIRNTSVDDLEPISLISGLLKLDMGGTKIKSLKYIARLTKLEELYINNTRIKSIKPLLQLSNLNYLKCYNTLIKPSKINEYKRQMPNVEVVFY
tara:strand:- start:1656 stop:4289 length:2634 start_codon:yes stop_codon:yes gene_type:complete